MAIPVNIEDLISHRVVESTRIEYKADFNPAPIIRSICACSTGRNPGKCCISQIISGQRTYHGSYHT